MKLTNIDGVSLLDKRGYLTICINQKADGRMYLRLQEGIRDWFYHLQSSVYESKRRRKFWVKGPTLGGGGSGGGLGNNRLARLYGERILQRIQKYQHLHVQCSYTQCDNWPNKGCKILFLGFSLFYLPLIVLIGRDRCAWNSGILQQT